ncbi:MAG: RNA methyltransferase [Bacteroidales bacterium]|nr:RNA methyltransferase [Candidatus Colimorpha onthohippi]
MISRNKLRELSVYKQSKACDADNVFVVEGVKLCEEALVSKAVIKVICGSEKWFFEHPNVPVNAECYTLNTADLERLSSMRTPNEVWMLVERLDILASTNNNGLILALDHLQDPGNLGTIIRTADWYGIRHIVCSPDTVSCYNPKVVQATMGGIFRTRIDYLPLEQWLASCGMPIYGALLDGQDIRYQKLATPAVLVIGNESRGITANTQQYVTHRIAIPNIGGTAESLNASVAAAIIIHDFMTSTN